MTFGSGTLICDIGAAASGASSVTMVRGYATSTVYSCWGHFEGQKYCCSIDLTGYGNPDVKVYGSPQGDTLKLTYLDMSTSTTYNLSPHTSGAVLHASVEGGEGADNVRGSDSQSADYVETLNGNDGDDTLNGGWGDDTCNGGEGEDTVLGGLGDDDLDGGPGVDEMLGGVGSDTMSGGTGNDRMSGGDDDDFLYGDGGADTICGDGGADWVDDNDSVAEPVTHDILWGAGTGDTVVCGNATTQVDNLSATLGTCSGTYLPAGRPPLCP